MGRQANISAFCCVSSEKKAHRRPDEKMQSSQANSGCMLSGPRASSSSDRGLVDGKSPPHVHARCQLTQVEGLMGKQVELVRELMPQATTVATEAVTRAPADGHMLLLVVPANVDPVGLAESSPYCYRACP
jgi:hypothetical protein